MAVLRQFLALCGRPVAEAGEWWEKGLWMCEVRDADVCAECLPLRVGARRPKPGTELVTVCAVYRSYYRGRWRWPKPQ